MNRRNFISGMLAAPVVIRTPGLLMPVRQMPQTVFIFPSFQHSYGKFLALAEIEVTKEIHEPA